MPYAFGAAAGGGALPQITINKSQTWVPPQDGTVCIHVIGAGGSGSVHNETFGGGGGGAYAKIPSLAVTTAGSFTLVVGVGGAARRGSAGTQQTGAAGGSSTIAGTGITGTLTCAGGAGGRTDMYSASVMYNAAGGAVSGSTNEGWAGFAGSYGFLSGGSVRIYSAGANSASTKNPEDHGEISDVGAGGIAMSGYGTICGGARGGQWTVNMLAHGTRYMPMHGEDFCGGGYAYSSLTSQVQAGDGGIGAGGGSIKATTGGAATYGTSGRGGHGLILIQYLS
tara:strand:+ start:985 stop:1827 length:843 start_codon:yes stop_codon:yes gene_type:complete